MIGELVGVSAHCEPHFTSRSQEAAAFIMKSFRMMKDFHWHTAKILQGTGILHNKGDGTDAARLAPISRTERPAGTAPGRKPSTDGNRPRPVDVSSQPPAESGRVLPVPWQGLLRPCAPAQLPPGPAALAAPPEPLRITARGPRRASARTALLIRIPAYRHPPPPECDGGNDKDYEQDPHDRLQRAVAPSPCSPPLALIGSRSRKIHARQHHLLPTRIRSQIVI